MLIEWLGFLLALAALLLISQKNLGVAMFVGAGILGAFLIPGRLVTVFFEALANPSTILLALIVGVIPIIGGTLETSGKMDELINNMRIGKKAFLMLSPALIGLLPMPGGALLSTPLIEKGGGDVPNEKKAGINIWFRHVLYLVYPLSAALIVSTEVARINMYEAIPYLIPFLLIAIVLGYLFILRGTIGEIAYEEKFSPRKLLLVLLALLIAPFLDISIKTLIVLPVKEIATAISVLTSLFISLAVGGIKAKNFVQIVKKAKPWDFAFMMFGIMVFLSVFTNSGFLRLIETIPITKETLFVTGFLLGFGTGRIITPAGIIFPIFLAKFGPVSLPAFAFIYFGIFLGYIITPVHPCVSLSISYFKIGIKEYLATVASPTLVAFIIGFILLATTGLS